MQKPTFKQKVILISSSLIFGVLLIGLYIQNPGLLSNKDSNSNSMLKGGLQIIASPTQNASKPVLNFKTPSKNKEPLIIKARTFCGNGKVESGEQCDDGNKVTESCSYGQENCLVCDASCKNVSGSVSFCGNGNLDPFNGEVCDDGNKINGDGCSSQCQNEIPNEPTCGNGVVEAGEACDGGQDCTENCEFSQIETVEMPLGDYFNSVFSRIIEKDSNQYNPPTNSEKQGFKAALEMFMDNKEMGAQAFEPLDYKVTRLIDTSDQNTVHYVIEESELDAQGNFNLGWGTLFIREDKNDLQVANLHLSVPHPKFDTNTPLFGLKTYELSGETLYMAGAHRNANNVASPLQPDYKISDQSHNNAILTVIGEVFANSADDVFVEFHGHETLNYPTLLQGGYNAVLSIGSASQTSPLQIAAVNIMGENGFNGPAGCGIQFNNILCGTNNTLKEVVKNKQVQSDFLHVELGSVPRNNLNKESNAIVVAQSIVEAVQGQ